MSIADDLEYGSGMNPRLRQILQNLARAAANHEGQPSCSIQEVIDSALAVVSVEAGRRLGKAISALKGD